MQNVCGNYLTMNALKVAKLMIMDERGNDGRDGLSSSPRPLNGRT